jgi:hypothetical protein
MSYTANDFYKDEMNRLQEKQQNADSITNSQVRLAELNDSYRKRYAKYVQILMVLILAYGIYLAMILLQKMIPVIPQMVVDVITVVLIFLVAFYLFNAGWELYSRSVLNYDELDLPSYDSSGVDVSNLAEKGQIFDFQGNTMSFGLGVCMGQSCCPEDTHTYDSTTNKCVLKSTAPKQMPFTTLEYENVNSAYNLSVTNAALKREPNVENLTPFKDNSALIYSDF